MPQRILSDDWSYYDNRKKKYADADFFSWEELWERDYLIKKILKLSPQYKETDIEIAINACCREVRAPRPRKVFVECVIRRLRR